MLSSSWAYPPSWEHLQQEQAFHSAAGLSPPAGLAPFFAPKLAVRN